jgi:stage II sporulation protein AA (anti-sigma F factor antagonist)
MEMKVFSETVPIVRVKGEIDCYVAPKLESLLEKVIDLPKKKNLIFDFSELNYIDSSGIEVLFSSCHKLAKRGGRTGIVVTDKNVLRILELVGILSRKDLFVVDDTIAKVEEGLA